MSAISLVIFSRIKMRRYLLVWLVCLMTTGMAVADSKDSYRIGPGDMLSISVFGEEDMSLKEVRVGTNGTISFALLGELKVNALTVRELEADLIRRLKNGYLKKPVITVSVLEYRLFYVNGEVKNPGGYNFVDGLTVQRAVALAGGFTERASKSKINLERETAPGVVHQSVGLNEAVSPGDVITVGESFF
ncbi:polysaccharide biosynthesis/export family protein [Sulfuriflexus mobilis]|uniref:polysaccharide biosynthesis/export family protein n=1 Tax=Sulfuriflexus mobilis TaxID=1811807 RepID=UPI000F842137|nr:polysaccharide biosynthesis/export family protein [Sulfuriflexus mobilis]